MILAPWHDVAMRTQEIRYSDKKIGHYKPKVSVIIPAWNEEVGLLNTVKTILKSTYTNVEIVVVNDGSTDNSDGIMRAFTARYKNKQKQRGEGNTVDLRYFYIENGGKGKALNYGISNSTGDIIMSIDADCAVLPDTIGNFVKVFRNPKVMAAVGNVKIGDTNTLLGTLQYLEFLFSFYFKKAESFVNSIYIIGGAAGAFRREVFEKIGVYNHSNITEDIELSVRIQRAGMKIVYAADAIVFTEGAAALGGLIKQRLRWKRGRFQTFNTHKKLFFSADRKHNKVLSWVVLPLALFGDLQLFFELYFVAFLYIYSLYTHDFSSFISGIIVVSAMFFVQLFFEDKTKKRASLYFLAPIGWLMFYISTFVEYNALVKSAWGSATKQKLIWQKWERKGVSGEAPATL
jgi:cellulose synthase/poly-beta-1,6-N-acetylglucosamine synthase-like glycosyltransferase